MKEREIRNPDLPLCLFRAFLVDQAVLLDGPAFAVREAAVGALEELRGFLVALELPLEPGEGRDGELAAVLLAVGAAVAHRVVRGEGRNLHEAVEVVHAVLIGDVLGTAQDVDDRNSDLLEALLVGHRHVRNGRARVDEQAAVADHDRGQARVRSVVQRLQAAAGHAGRSDVLHVDPAVVRAVLVGILRDGPVDGLDLLGGGGHGPAIGLLFHRDVAGGNHEEAVGGDLIQELVVFPRGVCAGTVAPDEDGQQILLAERGEVLGREDGVRFQRGILQHQHLVGTGTAVFDDFGLAGHGSDRAALARGAQHQQARGGKESDSFHIRE